MKTFKIFTRNLHFLISIWFFTASLSFARVSVNALPAPEGFHWEEEINKSENLLNLKLTENNGENTELLFSFSLDTGLPIISNTLDKKRKLIIPKPGRILYEAHQGQKLSLEASFLNVLRSIGYKKLEINFFETGANGKITYSTIEDFLKIAKAQNFKKPGVEEFIDDLENQVKNTERLILKEKGIKLPENFINFLFNFDLLQPVKNSENGEGERIDAFTLLPVKMFEKYGDFFLDEIKKAGKTKVFNPVTWFFNSKHLPFDLKLGIFSLITHNHLTEMNLIVCVILKENPDKAWETYKAINNLYKNERLYWFENYRTRVENNKYNYEIPTDIPWQIKQGSLYINLNLNEVKPEGENRTMVFDLPFYKRYHYYGAFIISYLMKKKLNLPDLLIKTTSVQFGKAYKTLTAGKNSGELDMMKQYYLAGASHALQIIKMEKKND